MRRTGRPGGGPGSHATSFHFIPTSSSWLNAVEGFFAKRTGRRLQHGVFGPVDDLKSASTLFIDDHNENEANPSYGAPTPVKSPPQEIAGSECWKQSAKASDL